MTDYSKLVEDLRGIEKTMFALGTTQINMDNVSISLAYDKGWGQTANDAAAAIEALQAEVDTLKRTDSKRCQECLYLGQPVGEQQLPKRGEWIDSKERMRPDMCSACGCIYEADRFMDKIAWHYCPNCGSLMVGENDERN